MRASRASSEIQPNGRTMSLGGDDEPPPPVEEEDDGDGEGGLSLAPRKKRKFNEKFTKNNYFQIKCS
jgi:hypothetical protein